MNREELIAEATKESARRWPSPNSGLYEGLTRGFVLGATWAIEKAQAPTDDEREALSHLLNETDPEGGIDFEDEHSDKQFWFPQADAILAAGFRRPAQDKGYHVELGDQRFTQAQWEAVQRYCEGRPVTPEPSGLPEYFAPNPPMTTNRFTTGQEEQS